MKLGSQYLAISLVVGVIAGLFLSSFVETPLNPTKEITSTVTNTTTITTTKTLALWPYSLSFSLSGAGPENWGYDMQINPDGSAVVNYHVAKKGSANLTLSKGDLDGLSILLLRANILHLNSSYQIKQGYYDWGYYRLTLTNRGQTYSVGWAAYDSAVESTPKELHEIASYLSDIAHRVIP